MILKDNALEEAGLRHVGEERLQRFGVVREIHAVVAQLGQDHLYHEGLESEAVTLLLHASSPKFHQAHDLREVIWLGLLALLGEVKMQRNTGFQEGVVILADQIATLVWQVSVQDWHEVHIQPGPAK